MSDNLTAALAAVQAKLPEVRKGETATVPTKTGGSYKYSYADLAAVSKAILPILGEHGLTWITKPTLTEAGRFVLAYKLKHVSGDEEVGEYPLPSNGTPQEIGSAITYARRYTLCSVTGVAPEQDDDDGAAASRPQRDEWEQAAPAPTDKQTQTYTALLDLIRAADEADQITAIGKDVHNAKVSGQITPMHYERLARAASARLAELTTKESAQVAAAFDQHKRGVHREGDPA